MKFDPSDIRKACGKRPKKSGAGPSEKAAKKARVERAIPVSSVPPARAEAEAEAAVEVMPPEIVLPNFPVGDRSSPVEVPDEDDAVLTSKFSESAPPVPRSKRTSSSRSAEKMQESSGKPALDKGKRPIIVEDEIEEAPTPQEEAEESMDSRLETPSMAAKLIKSTILEPDWTTTSRYNVGELRQFLYRDILKVIHWSTGLDETLTELCQRFQTGRDVARADWESASKINGDLSLQLAGAEEQIEALNRTLKLKEEDLHKSFLDRQFLKTELEKGIEAEKKRVLTAEEKLQKVEEALEAEKGRVLAAEEATEEAKKAAKAASAKLLQAEEDFKKEIERADQAIDKAHEKAERSLEDFRSSGEFRKEVLSCGAQSYQLGHNDLLQSVHRRFPDLDLSSFEMEFVSEEAGEELEESEGEPPVAEADPQGSEELPKENPGEVPPAEVPGTMEEVVAIGAEAANMAEATVATEASVTAAVPGNMLRKEASSEDLGEWTP